MSSILRLNWRWNVRIDEGPGVPVCIGLGRQRISLELHFIKC